MQSKKTTEVRVDLRILMSPLFYGISEFSSVCMAKLESKVSFDIPDCYAAVVNQHLKSAQFPVPRWLIE